MKNSIIIALLTLSSGVVAQTKIEKNLSVDGGEVVYLDFKYANEVKVNTWDQNNVKLTAHVTINGGKQDDVYQIEAVRQGRMLEFSSNSDDIEDRWKTITTSDDCCPCCHANMVVNIEVQMPEKLGLEFNSISGSITTADLRGGLDLNTISGDITVSAKQNRLYLKSISGDVEVLVPEGTSADLEANTLSGEIYTNLEALLSRNKKGLKQVMGQTVEAELNQGGENWDIETISGDIFIRKI